MKRLKDFLKRVGSELAGLFSPALVPLRALVVTLLGVALSRLWYDSQYLSLVLLTFGPVVVAYVAFYIGRARLPHNPRAGLLWMEFWIIAPLVVAVVAVCGTVILAVELAAPEDASAGLKKQATTISTAVGTFFSTSFVAWTADQKSSRMSSKVRDAFYEKYKRTKPPNPARFEDGVCYVDAESTAELAVYSSVYHGLSGWGLSDRWERATLLKTNLPLSP